MNDQDKQLLCDVYEARDLDEVELIIEPDYFFRLKTYKRFDRAFDEFKMHIFKESKTIHIVIVADDMSLEGKVYINVALDKNNILQHLDNQIKQHNSEQFSKQLTKQILADKLDNLVV